jgi:uncharacterized protein (TIGR02680 family)
MAEGARWRPVRAGIRNIWEYDDQVFQFADGRLILRGPNGSGKSNALALLFPFVLDATMAANRMDPFAGGRSMKSLLLCARRDDDPGGGSGSGYRHDQRTGYVWLELGRPIDEGEEHLTLGVGARATTQRDATAWFFLTTRRPGVDLELAPGGTCLTQPGLVEELGRTSVFDTAEAYRDAVAREVLGVGPERYRNLLELVLVLRRPQLAGRLNLDLVAKVLSDGLPVLDPELVADVAASFEDLEAVQADLRRLQVARQVVDRFVPVHRTYVRTVAATRAGALLGAGRELRSARARVGAAEAALAALAEEATGVERRQRKVGAAVVEVRGRHRAHLESPAYRDAKALVDLAERAGDARTQAVVAADLLEQAEGDLAGATAEHGTATAALAGATEEEARAIAAVAGAADEAGIAWVLGAAELAGVDDLGTTLRAPAVERRDDVRIVAEALRDATRARDAAGAAESAASRSLEAADAAAAEQAAAEGALDTARSELAEAVAAWGRATEAATADDVVALTDAVVEERGLVEVLGARWQPRREALAADAARALDRHAALEAEQVALRARRAEVAAERDDGPVPPPWRSADRAGRRGAPLYACCDFADGVDGADRAGLEAALEASGLLDAWVAPGGAAGDDQDAWLRPGPAVAEPSLATVLVPSLPEGSGLDRSDVAAVLRSVGLAEAGVAVGADGRFVLGPLAGRASKAAAGYVGASARAERRRRRLADIDAELTALGLAIEEAEAEHRRAVEVLDALAAAVTALPSPAGVAAAQRRVEATTASAATARALAAGDAAAAADAHTAAVRAEEHLLATAGQRRLPTDAAGLDAVTAAVAHYLDLVGVAVQARTARRNGEEGVARAETRLATAEERRAARASAAQQAGAHAAGLEARVAELRASLGGDPDAPLRRLVELEEELERLGRESEELAKQAIEVAGRLARAEGDHERAVADVTTAEERERRAGARLDVLRRGDLWPAVVDPAAGPPPDDPMALARLVAEATAGVDAGEEARQEAHRAHSVGFKALLDELRFGYDPSSTPVDDIDVVAVTSESGTVSVLDLARLLAEQATRQEEYLSERDREIFERHLLTRVSEALRDLLNDADAFVDEVNACLRETPTASGLRVELRWELEADDPATRRAVALLRRSPELLGPDDREQLRRFFAMAIAAQRAEDPGASYAAVLATVLDHRRWHTFRPQLGQVGSAAKPLTRTLFRTLSGGEQAVALHLPLFAAAAAHYRAASPLAPRLVALDEAFAGIDEAMRGELFGLLVRFDLDVILTGHELWGDYEEVPAVAVYDLLRRPPAEGVSALLLRWEGGRPVEA